MKTFVRSAVLLWAVTAMCQARLALAEDFRWVTSGSQSATLVGDQKAATEQAPCSSCGQVACCEEACGSCCGAGAGAGAFLGCDDDLQRGVIGFAGFDSFKGVSDGSYNSNFGVVTGLNSALGLGDSGIGWQLGMSYGVYDLDGRTTVNQATSQQQVFITTGFFHKAHEERRLSFGIVYDWMLNDQWGIYATTPTLGQWRGQVEWAVSGSNAFGAWGCVRDMWSRQLYLRQVPITTRPISQANLFWHHKFATGADSYVWVGGVEDTRLSGYGSLGAWIVGASVQAPLSDRLALYGNAQYMHPSASAGALAAIDSGYNVGMGIVWYFGGHAVSHAINGKCNLPYMPVANNSTFMVDQYPAL